MTLEEAELMLPARITRCLKM